MTFNPNPNLRQAIQRAALDGASEIAQDILARSLILVPLDERPVRNDIILENTAAVTVVEAELSVYISYDTEYAVMQHENQDYYHPAPRQSKYLQVPFAETPIGDIVKTIGNKIKAL